MQYGELISRSWSIFWHHRYLWLLGALGGGEATGGFGGNFGSAGGGGGGGGGGASSQAASEFVRWLQDALPLLIGMGALLAVVLIAYLLVSCVTTGALIRATAEHDAERPFGLGIAWSSGLGTFWRILGLRLLLFVIVLLVIAGLAGVFGLGAAIAANASRAAGGVIIAIAVLILIVLIPVLIAASIVVTLATRSIVLDQLGVFAALGRGIRLLFGRLGRVLLVWLLSIALGLGAGVVAAAAVLVVALPLGLIGVATYAAYGLSAVLTTAVFLLFVFLLATIAIGGVTGTFMSAYWTLAFRRLELDAVPPAAAAPAPPS